jgi:hypothetical protein
VSEDRRLASRCRRKTDVSDVASLCQLVEAGLLRRSLVPPKPIRALGNPTRYRKAQIGERHGDLVHAPRLVIKATPPTAARASRVVDG